MFLVFSVFEILLFLHSQRGIKFSFFLYIRWLVGNSIWDKIPQKIDGQEMTYSPNDLSCAKQDLGSMCVSWSSLCYMNKFNEKDWIESWIPMGISRLRHHVDLNIYHQHLDVAIFMSFFFATTSAVYVDDQRHCLKSYILGVSWTIINLSVSLTNNHHKSIPHHWSDDTDERLLNRFLDRPFWKCTWQQCDSHHTLWGFSQHGSESLGKYLKCRIPLQASHYAG